MTAIIISAVVSWAVTFVCAGISGYLINRYKKAKSEQQEKIKEDAAREEAQKNGLLALLRAELIRLHDKYTERGYCPIYGKEAARTAYEAYHNLGGNGVITKLYNDIMALPEESPKKAPPTNNRKGGAHNGC